MLRRVFDARSAAVSGGLVVVMMAVVVVSMAVLDGWYIGTMSGIWSSCCSVGACVEEWCEEKCVGRMSRYKYLLISSHYESL